MAQFKEEPVVLDQALCSQVVLLRPMDAVAELRLRYAGDSSRIRLRTLIRVILTSITEPKRVSLDVVARVWEMNWWSEGPVDITARLVEVEGEAMVSFNQVGKRLGETRDERVAERQRERARERFGQVETFDVGLRVLADSATAASETTAELAARMEAMRTMSEELERRLFEQRATWLESLGVEPEPEPPPLRTRARLITLPGEDE